MFLANKYIDFYVCTDASYCDMDYTRCSFICQYIWFGVFFWRMYGAIIDLRIPFLIWDIENRILDKLHHTFSTEQIPFPHQMLPAKYTDKKKDDGYNPSHKDHHKYLQK